MAGSRERCKIFLGYYIKSIGEYCGNVMGLQKEGPIILFIKRSGDIMDKFKGLDLPGNNHHLPCQGGLSTFLVTDTQTVELRQPHLKMVNLKKIAL